MNDIRIRAVAFDIDGTLYPNRPMYVASLPVVLMNPRLFRAFGRAREEIRARRPIDNLRRETAELTARFANLPVETADALIQAVIYDRWERVLDRVPTYAGVRDLLTWLRDQGIRTAAMSDFPVSRKLDRIGLSGLWDAAFSSEETGYLKPNPEPFRRLLDELATEPQHLLYVGNSYRYDIEGARALGIRTAHLGGKPQKPRNADVAFRRFSELRAWLADKIEPTTSSHD